MHMQFSCYGGDAMKSFDFIRKVNYALVNMDR